MVLLHEEEEEPNALMKHRSPILVGTPKGIPH